MPTMNWIVMRLTWNGCGEISKRAVNVLIESLTTNQTPGIHRRTIEILKQSLLEEQLSDVITRLKAYSLAPETGGFSSQELELYKLLWHCSEPVSYGNFVAAWHSKFPS
ncbi:MAG: hypothetical protein HC835_08465 [Oscillatoriales cyanobacterium RM2_1_1]|nr:hypothetical protein [Oscillatoriales cyanobacterium SM2_3_0]NJO45652.1 hypothetical protein [Oscillatoriales cyanobacterium RM2_1_1]